MVPKKLTSEIEKELVINHLCKLQGEDRRLRFGAMTTNELIRSYVEKSWDSDDSQWFGCLSKGKIVSSCHVAIYKDEAELGCSVDKDYRGMGLAQSMFDRAVTYLRAGGITNVYMHCLTENDVMRHIAKKNDMTVVSCSGETDANIKVSPPTMATAMKDAYLDRIAIYDMLIRTQSEIYGSWLESFKYERQNK